MNWTEPLFAAQMDGAPHLCVEMSGNHRGALSAALEFARQAKAAGADSLKVQVYRPDTITLDSDRDDFRLAADDSFVRYGNLFALYRDAHTPWDWVAEIFRLGREIDLPVFASPFDVTAVDFLETLDCPVYKIASPEINDIGLIERAAATGKPMILSTGLADAEDLERALAVPRAAGIPHMLLKCVSAYPTPVADSNIASIPWLASKFACPAGLSDHTLGPAAGLAAAALGARLIEKHCRLPDDVASVDASFSMALDAVPDFKRQLQAVSAAVGRPTLEIPASARSSLIGRRSLYVVADVAQGEVFTQNNLRSIRPAHGLPPRHLPALLGRRARRDIARGERMSWDLVADEAAE